MTSSDKKNREYHFKKLSSRTYVSSTQQREDLPRYRVVSRVIDSENIAKYMIERGKRTIQISEGGRTEWIARVFEDDRSVSRVTLQRYEKKSGKDWVGYHFDFKQEELSEFLKFLRILKIIPLDSPNSQRYENTQLQSLLSGNEQWLDIFENNKELVLAFVKNNLTETDIVSLGYRKKQLKLFDKLLHDEKYFQAVRNKNGLGSEAIWQKFFETNPWIFGYGLNLIFTIGLEHGKLELPTTGSDWLTKGKRTDALMKTRGYVSSLCFVEIKTHKTSLLKPVKEAYRSDCWQPSDELSGAVSQAQKTVHKALDKVTAHTSQFQTKNGSGEPTGEILHMFQPKSYLVVGNLEEFSTPNGINEEKFGSFELYRRNTNSPEIITFDELFYRAKYIVSHAEKTQQDKASDFFDMPENILNIGPSKMDKTS